jgi:dsDNA-binding SOS-regulon protein
MPNTMSLKQLDEAFDNDRFILIVIYEKHGNRQLIAKTEDGFFNYFLNLLKERKEDSYFYEPEKPKLPSINSEIFDSLPEGETKNAAKKELDRYNKSLNYYNDLQHEWLNVNKAIQDSNGRLAYFILKNRSDMGVEYETMLVEVVTVI